MVAAGVIAVGVGVDDVGDRFVGDRLDLIEDRLTVVGVLGVHDDDAALRDVDRRVPALPLNQIQVVLDLLDGLNRRASATGGAAARSGFAPLSGAARPAARRAWPM